MSDLLGIVMLLCYIIVYYWILHYTKIDGFSAYCKDKEEVVLFTYVTLQSWLFQSSL